MPLRPSITMPVLMPPGMPSDFSISAGGAIAPFSSARALALMAGEPERRTGSRDGKLGGPARARRGRSVRVLRDNPRRRARAGADRERERRQQREVPAAECT
jgi:hypothetical protein